MGQPWQTIVTIFYIAWPCGALWLLWSIWRVNVTRQEIMLSALVDAARRASDAAVQAASAAKAVAETAKLLAEKLKDPTDATGA